MRPAPRASTARRPRVRSRSADVGCGSIRRRYGAAMSLNLFAGIAVSDYATATTWYERLLGAQPSFSREIGFGGAVVSAAG